MDVGNCTDAGNYMDAGKVTGGMAERAVRAAEPLQRKETPEELQKNILKKDAACTLHISEDGYRRWEQANELSKAGLKDAPGGQPGAAQKAEIAAAELKDAPGGQPGAAQKTEVAAAELFEGEDEPPLDRAARIQQFVDRHRYLLDHVKPKASKETDKEKCDAMEELRQLEEDQEEQYRKMEAEALKIARKRTKTRNTVEKGMRELTIMLESVRPQEKDRRDEKDVRQDQENGAAKEQTFLEKEEQPKEVLLENSEGETVDARETMYRLGRIVKGHGFRKELAMDKTVERIYENARANFAAARGEDRELRSRLESLYNVLKQPETSEADRDAAAEQFLRDGQRSLVLIGDEMGYGLERLNNLRMLRMGRLENRNMLFAGRSQENINAAAEQTVLDELYLDGFEEAEEESFEELAAHIRELQEEERRPEAQQAERERTEEETDGRRVSGKEAEETEENGQ